MTTPTNSKQYNSIFTNEIDIDIANYLTELLMCHRMEWLKKSKPRCAFWRKEFYEKDKTLAEFAKLYGVEIVGVKQLLKVFKPEILAKYFQDKHIAGFKTFRKETQDKTILELYKLQSTQKEIEPKKEQPTLAYGGSAPANASNKMSILHGED